MTDWHIAQINVARGRFLIGDPGMAGFVARLDEINALADASPGFVWRLESEPGNATDIQATDDPRLIVNLSVWRDVRSLFDFAYRSAHREVMAQRRQWFEPPAGAYQALWWIEAGRLPDVAEGLRRLRRLEREGPTRHAFTFKRSFPPPGRAGTPETLAPEPCCVGWA